MTNDDRPKPFDVPLVNIPDSQPFGSPIVDFAGIRVAQGMRKFHHRNCEHRRLVYNTPERRIWCEECERTIEAFDAFKMLADNFHQMALAAESDRQRAKEALGMHLVRRAAKNVDRTWGNNMAPACPHCGGGILAHDMLGCGSVSAEIEVARRKRDLAEKSCEIKNNE